ncbi:MAG: sugar transporter permease [Paenibacillus sp.]|nr:sugar transporter permease [Paenibacillus sp.]
MRRREQWTAWLFLSPSLIGFSLFLAFPILFSLILAFSEWDLISGFNNIRFIGLDNFFELFQSDVFYSSLKNNVLFTLIVVPGTMIISLLIAMVLNSYVYAPGILRLAFFMPYITTIVAVSIVWLALFHPSLGPVNQFLALLGVENLPQWLASPLYALPTISLMMIWVGMGFDLVVYMAALKGVPRHLLEAAEIDGATGFRKFLHITLPLISPATFFLLITRIIASFEVFGPINIMTAGGPGKSSSVLVYELYEQAFRFYRMGYGSAIAWVLFALIFAITILQWVGQKKWVTYS